MRKSARKGAGDRGDKMVAFEFTNMCTCRFCANCESVEVDLQVWTCPMCDAELDGYSECFGQCVEPKNERFSQFMHEAGVEGDDERLFIIRKDGVWPSNRPGYAVVSCTPVDLPRELGPDDEWRQEWASEGAGAFLVVQYHHDAPVGEAFAVRELVFADASAFEPYAKFEFVRVEDVSDWVRRRMERFDEGLREALTYFTGTFADEHEAASAWEDVYEDPETMWARGLANYVYLRGLFTTLESVPAYQVGREIGKLVFRGDVKVVDPRAVDRVIDEIRQRN